MNTKRQPGTSKTLLLDNDRKITKADRKLRADLAAVLEGYIGTSMERMELALGALLDLAAITAQTCAPEGWKQGDYEMMAMMAFDSRLEAARELSEQASEVH